MAVATPKLLPGGGEGAKVRLARSESLDFKETKGNMNETAKSTISPPPSFTTVITLRSLRVRALGDSAFIDL